MDLFATLLDRLVVTPQRNRKIALLAQYFAAAPDPDRGFALACLTDGVPIRVAWRRTLLDLIVARSDPVLYKLSRDYIGDTAETVALLWPDAPSDAARPAAPRLAEVIAAFRDSHRSRHPTLIAHYLDHLDARGRWAFLKLLGGAPRAGISARLAKVALADWAKRDVGEIEEVWHALEAPYVPLFGWLEGRSARPDPGLVPVFRPVMLAHPIEEPDWASFDPAQYVAEWKWDGIRIQVSAKGEDVRLFSRAGDDISAAFPDVRSSFVGRELVADGELLVVRDGVVAPFNDLQQRLNRKVVSAKMLKDHPAHVRLYDLLIVGSEDLRALPFTERRKRLEAWHCANPPRATDISELVPFSARDDLDAIWGGARAAAIEGLMLKRRDSAYVAGRVKGLWWKWKRSALTLDCVLMYAQRGSGKRSSFYSDYTFGVWKSAAAASMTGAPPLSADSVSAAELVPVGKAYSGFTDAELKDLDRWIRQNTTEAFGPVRAVTPGLVFEVAFDAVHRSARHKSGVAMRFPRIHRIRWDKPAAEADRLETVMALIDA
ncbi:MAG: cisplatin damage response ATP-dependent DNA ligase [Hyphomicrobiaceae bacterium]|nr:cisplatin damage response ATP-dependent DNA ligase [Hyphomicrobiaceae bacterium]